MGKSKRLKRQNVNCVRNSIKATYDNKYYNMFIDSFKFDGDIEYEEKKWILKQLWTVGSFAITKNEFVDMLVYTPYSCGKYNMYEFPEEIRLINIHQSPLVDINRTYINNKDVVICYALSTEQPVMRLVNYYIDRMVQVDMVINTNLTVHKLPLFVPVSEQDIEKANDIVDRILNDEVVIFKDMNDVNIVKSFASGAPYIIDKLYQYRKALESELQTLLGIDNAGSDNSKDRFLVDEVNANNIETNLNKKGMLDNINEAFKKVNDLFGINITVKSNVEDSTSIHEEPTPMKEGGTDDVL